jgi:hypothetical protein
MTKKTASLGDGMECRFNMGTTGDTARGLRSERETFGASNPPIRSGY